MHSIVIVLKEVVEQLFPVPQHEPVDIELETLGALEDSKNNQNRTQNKRQTVRAQRWPFKAVWEDYLLDPQVFGLKENLVDPDTPFEKYKPKSREDRSLHAGKWYQDTYDTKVTNPKTEFLESLIIYVDKSGRTTGIGSSCGEPMIVTSGHLTMSARMHR